MKCIGQTPDFPHLTVGQQNFHDVETDFCFGIFQQVIKAAIL
jgi:hypothetical protein